ncbi:MAG: EAL domain-containing protein [Acidobacteria bacterium]|nr:EAL domain-containing protein [Acidobacteriota bacterium]
MSCLLLPQWWALSRNEEQRRQELRVALRTTADTTELAIQSWESEALRQAQAVVQSPEVADAFVRLQLGSQGPIEADGPLLRGAQAAGFSAVALLDADGRVAASSDSDWEGRTVPPEQLENLGQGPGKFIRWEGSGPWTPAVAAPAPKRAGTAAGFVVLTMEPLPELSNLVRERALGRSGRTSLFAVGGPWLVDSTGTTPPDCSRPPEAVLDEAAGSGRRGLPGSPSFNLDGYRDCRGGEAVGVWTISGDAGLGLITEISYREAYGSLSTSRVTFVGFGVMLAGLLLMLVLIQTSGDPTPIESAPRPPRSNAAWGILGVALLATVIAWVTARSRYLEHQRDRFTTSSQRVEADFRERLESHAAALDAARGALEAFPAMDVAEWRRFLAGLNLRENFPAISCVTAISVEQRRVEPRFCYPDAAADSCALCRTVRGDEALADAVGEALDSHEPVATILASGSPDARRLLAVVTAPPQRNGAKLLPVGVLDLEQLARNMTRERSFAIEMELYEGAEPTPEALLYESGGDLDPAQASEDIPPRKSTFVFGGRQWTLALAPAESLATPITQNYPAQVLLAGLAISVLLFDIALVLSSTRSRALAIAELMTRRFRDGEVRIRAVLDSAPDGIVTFDAHGVIQTFNPGAEKLFGYSAEEAREIRIVDLLPDLDLSRVQPAEGMAFDGVRKDGGHFPSEIALNRTQIGESLLYTAIVRDVSARREAQEKLEESEQRYALAARGANDGLWDWNLKTNSVYFSARWRSMIGIEDGPFSVSPDEWLGRVHSEDVVTLRKRLADHLEGRVPHFECEYRIRHANGGYRWMLCRGIAVRDEDSAATRIAGSQTDITERKRAERQLLYDALHDPLTGLPNRTYFMGRVDQARLEASRSSNRMFGLLFLDIDRFKVVNDSLGHFVGDQLLVAVSERLKGCLRPGDTICRLGGDEFAILVEHLDGVSDATRIAERIQHELERPLRVGEREIFAAVSIGIALSSTGKQTADELLRDADLAMYRAKSRGKARYELFTQRLHTRAVELLQLETDLRHAVERNELVLHYQPIVDLATGRIGSCEALIRWNHPPKGLVPPSDFIGVAEESGAIVQITRWLMEAACRQRKAWIEQGLPPVRVSVNISPRQLLQQDIFNLVTDTLAATEQPPEALQLELTESALMESSESTVTPLKELYAKGVRISLDDFGTGYSSLIYLRRFPIHNIKIDQSFVRSIPHDEGNAAIASGLIALAHSLNLQVVAEGVETMEQLRFLQERGCDEVQGYVVSQPVPAEAFGRLLLRRVDVAASDAASLLHPLAQQVHPTV